MIKKLILLLAVALPLSVFAQKFAVVDMDEIFTAMPETTAAQDQINEASKKYEAEFQKLQEKLQQLYTEFQAIQDDPNQPASIKERRMHEIETSAQNVETFRQTAAQDLQRQHEQLMAPIQQKIVDAIQTIGREGNYTFIFPNNQVAYYVGQDVVNITETVKNRLGVK